MGQCEEISIMEVEEKDSESDSLLLEGEEQEYFLELLMRTASPERSKTSQPTKDRDNLKSEAVTAKGKEKKRNRKKEKKVLRKNVARKETGERAEKEGATSQTNGLKKQPAPDIVNNPEAKGRGLASGDQGNSGGECSG
jgi:hypothetical protein